MLNIYNEEILNWCTNYCSGNHNCGIEAVIAYNLADYLSTNNVPQRKHTDVPKEYFYKKGYYIEVEPGSWRMVVQTPEEYIEYCNYLITRIKDTLFEDIYGQLLDYCGVGSYGLKTAKVKLNILNTRVPLVDLNTITLDIEDFNKLVNSKESFEVDKLCVTGPGKYILIYNVGWRRLCDTVEDLEDYYRMLKLRGVI